MNKFLKLIFIIIVFAIIGFSREFFFVQMNVILYEKYYNSINTEFPVAPIMKFFTKYSYSSLYYSKYIFTLLTVLVYYIVSFYSLKLLGYKNIIKYLSYCYLLLLTLAAITMLYGYIVNNRLQDSEYTISRWLLGIAQSPIIFLILIASQKLNNTLTKNNAL